MSLPLKGSDGDLSPPGGWGEALGGGEDRGHHRVAPGGWGLVKAEALVWLNPGTTGRVEQQEGEGWGSRFKGVGGRGQEQLKLHTCPLPNR